MVIHVIWLRCSNRESCLRFWKPWWKNSRILLSKSPSSHWLLQSYWSSGSAFGTLKNQLKDLYLYCSGTKLGFLSFHFVSFLRRNKMDKEMCFEVRSQMSIYRVPASWGNKFGLGITGRKAVKSFAIDFPRMPHCILIAIAEDSPKGQKHFVKYFWISKA